MKEINLPMTLFDNFQFGSLIKAIKNSTYLNKINL